MNRVSVLGLGKLGLAMAAVFASRGFEVTGVDLDDSKVDALNGGPCPILEPGLQDLLNANRKRLHGTSDHMQAVKVSDMTFVVVPTPSDETGGFSLRYVTPAMSSIGAAIASKDYHLVVLTSTVMPGSMASSVLPTLEESSGKKAGRDFGLCYSPEFIALGDVINGLLQPELVLIGESDKDAGDYLSEVQGRVCTNSPTVARMSFANAELTKISVNSFVTMKMSFANTIAEMCEGLPGGDIDAVTQAIGSDGRIGRLYLKGATGYGGPCFPRDNVAFAALARSLGTRAALAEAAHSVNTHQVDRIIDIAVEAGMTSSSSVSVLGLSYKPRTNVVDESQGLLLCKKLSNMGCTVHAHDPAALPNARTELGSSVEYHDSASEAISKSELCFVMTPWDEYRTLDPRSFKEKVVIDCWRILNTDLTAKKHIQIGVNSQRG